MSIKTFFKKFTETYNETYETEKKLLKEKQHEQINSLKVSILMGENLDEKEVLQIVKGYVSFLSKKSDTPKTYTFFESTRKSSICLLVKSKS